MELYVLRHAMAVDQEHTDRDAERMLTTEGRERLRRSTRCWDGLGVTVDLILTSPFLRARQSAEVAAVALGMAGGIEVCPALSAGASPSAIVRAIAERCQEDHRVMIVGHEPDLGRLVSVLVCGDDGAGFRMKKAGLTKLAVDGLEVGRCAVLEWHLWPRHMLRMT
jgi:phosphohistidine phosphatase